MVGSLISHIFSSRILEENEGETNVLTAELEDGERTDVRKDTKLKMIVDVIVVHTDEVV
jgi:hypothetical protein